MLGALRALLAVGIVFFAAAVRAGGPVAAAPPVIVFDRPECDFGTLLQGEQATALFTFRNGGGEDLRIFSVEPTCGCTSALLTAPVVPPAQQGSIRIVFDSSNFTGEVRKEITVRSSDEAHATVVLAIRALVEPEVAFEPHQVTFDDVQPGMARRETVMLTNRRSEPIQIDALEVSPASFTCRLPAWGDTARPFAVESWDRVEIEVVMTPPPAITMPIAGECVLRIRGPRKTHFTLKLLGLP